MPEPPFQPNQQAAFRYSRHVGSYASAAQLPNVAGATVQTPRLFVGAIAFNLGDTMLYLCTDATEGAAIWSALAAAGPPVFPDGATVFLTNSLNTNDNLDITRTFAGAGKGVDVNMGPGGEAVTDNAVDVTMGAGSSGHGLRVALAAGASGDGLHIEDSGSGPAIFANKIGAVGELIDLQDGSSSIFTITAAGAVTLTSSTSVAISVSSTGSMTVSSSEGDVDIDSSVGGVLTAGDVDIFSDATAAGATTGNVRLGVITSGGGTLKGFLAQIGGAALAVPAAGEIRVRAVGGADEFYEWTANAVTKGAKYRSVVGGAVTGADITMESDSTAAGATSSNVIVGSISSGGGTAGGVEVRAGGAAFGTPGTGVVDIEATVEVNIAPTAGPVINSGSGTTVWTHTGRMTINRAGGLNLVLDVNGTSGSGVEIDTDTGDMDYRTTQGDLTVSTTAPAGVAGGDITIQALGTNAASTPGDVRIGVVDANATVLGALILRTGSSFPAGGAGEIVINADGVLDIDSNGDMTLNAVGDITLEATSEIFIAPATAAVGFFGATPVGQSAAYTRNAAIVEDRTLLASASATIINNNNVLAALIADLQGIGILG